MILDSIKFLVGVSKGVKKRVLIGVSKGVKFGVLAKVSIGVSFGDLIRLLVGLLVGVLIGMHFLVGIYSFMYQFWKLVPLNSHFAVIG